MESKDVAHIDETARVLELLFSLLVALKIPINMVNKNGPIQNSRKNSKIARKFQRTIFLKDRKSIFSTFSEKIVG